MKHIFLFLFVNILGFSVMADATAQIYCDYTFDDKIIEITAQTPVNGCVADAVWGNKRACYEGSPTALVEQINNDNYVWLSAGLKMTEAELAEDGKTVIFAGIDYHYTIESDLLPCEAGFKSKYDQ